MDILKKQVTEKQAKIIYAVEWHTILNKFKIIRASWSYKGHGKTFDNLKEAKKYMDKENIRVKAFGK